MDIFRIAGDTISDDGKVCHIAHSRFRKGGFSPGDVHAGPFVKSWCGMTWHHLETVVDAGTLPVCRKCRRSKPGA